MAESTGWFDPWSPENEYIASSLYWRWGKNWSINAFPEWADLGGKEKEKWRERAQLALDTFEFEFEFAVRNTDPYVGVQYSTYEGSELAFKEYQSMMKYNPESDAKVVARVVGKWEEI